MDYKYPLILAISIAVVTFVSMYIFSLLFSGLALLMATGAVATVGCISSAIGYAIFL